MILSSSSSSRAVGETVGPGGQGGGGQGGGRTLSFLRGQWGSRTLSYDHDHHKRPAHWTWICSILSSAPLVVVLVGDFGNDEEAPWVTPLISICFISFVLFFTLYFRRFVRWSQLEVVLKESNLFYQIIACLLFNCVLSIAYPGPPDGYQAQAVPIALMTFAILASSQLLDGIRTSKTESTVQLSLLGLMIVYTLFASVFIWPDQEVIPGVDTVVQANDSNVDTATDDVGLQGWTKQVCLSLSLSLSLSLPPLCLPSTTKQRPDRAGAAEGLLRDYRFPLRQLLPHVPVSRPEA